jgi:transporter family protein
MFPAWAIFATVALVLWGVTGITQKLSTNRIASQLSFLWFAYAMVAISAVISLTTTIHWHLRPMIMVLCIAGGTLNGLGALTSFAALESGGKASIVISLISLFPLLTVAIAVLFLHERLTVPQGAGVLLAIIAAILLSMEAPTGASSSAGSK